MKVDHSKKSIQHMNKSSEYQEKSMEHFLKAMFHLKSVSDDKSVKRAVRPKKTNNKK